MSNAPKTGLRTKHWVGYMFGDWAAFKFIWNITPDVRAKMNAMKAGNK